MNVQIRDAAALRRVTPPMLRAYLESRGWSRREIWRGRIAVWGVECDGRSRQILAPLRESSDAYAVRMSDVVAALSETEERSQLDVYCDLLAAGADAIRLRSLNGVGGAEWQPDASAAVFGARAQTDAGGGEVGGAPKRAGGVVSAPSFSRHAREGGNPGAPASRPPNPQPPFCATLYLS